MLRIFVTLVIGLAFVLESAIVKAQCSSDGDCEANGVCNEAKCEYPSSEKGKEKEKKSKLRNGKVGDWFKAYGEIAAVISYPVWTSLGSEADYYEFPGNTIENGSTVSTSIRAGARLSGYFASHKNFHIGIYLQMVGGGAEVDPDLQPQSTWIPSEDRSNILATGAGVVQKTGFRVADRLFMGLELGLGLNLLNVLSWKNQATYNDQSTFDNNTFVGLDTVAKLFFDIMLVDRGSFKMAMPIHIGVEIVPFSSLEPFDNTWKERNTIELAYDGQVEEQILENLFFRFQQVSLVASIGLSFGR